MTEEKKTIVKDKDSQIPFEIPVEGSLGLLALGATGIIEWRKVRNAHNKKKKEEGDKQ